jgi:RND family efflux transporter MFP subunit
MNRIGLKKSLFLVVVLILGVGCAKTETEITDETIKIPITIEEVTNGVVQETFLALGSIEPQISIAIDTGGMGKVEEIYVKVGDRIKAGDKLFSLDADNLKLNYNTTESQLRTIRDNLFVQYLDVKETFDNQEVLFSQGAIAKAQLDQTSLLYEQLRRQYLDASTAYENQVKNIQDGIDDRTVTSPISGKVAIVYIKQNEAIIGNVAMEIIDDEFVVAISAVTSEQINRMVLGNAALIYPDGKMLQASEGQVARFNELPNDATGLYEVEIELDNHDHRLRSGEYVEIDFIMEKRESILISKAAIRKIGENQVVYIVENDRAVQRVISLGVEQGEMIEVKDGLNSGEIIAIKGAGYLRDGSNVLIVTEK